MTMTSFSSWPSFTQEEADAVSSTLLSNKVNYWTGKKGREFEKEFAAWSNCNYAIALANGTVALDVAMKALNIGSEDEVIVTPRTFLASVSSIVNAGAIPVFADIDKDSQNISASTISPMITSRTKAILCVHLAGWPCEMDEIVKLAKKHDLYVIEDCAQAHGAKYNNRSVGSIGHIGAWSFCQDKIMSTGGEGGMVTTNDERLWSKMWSYKDHGKSWEAVCQSQELNSIGFRWLHESFGTNWRMTEMQASIGLIQLKKMFEWKRLRLLNSNLIWAAASKLPSLRVPVLPPNIEHGAYKCYVFLVPERIKADWSRDRIINTINEQGIPCFSGSCSEVYLEKAFDGTGWRPQKRLPVAKMLGETSLMFLVHPTISTLQIQRTCQVLTQTMQLATRV